MYVLVKPKDPEQRLKIRAEIMAWLETSRFTAKVTLELHPRYGALVRIDNVRLRVAKDYCGQHPNECQVNGKRHRKGHWLEGADWVGFDDGLNDLFDQLAFNADVWSFNRECMDRRYYIRKGLCRRLDYDSVYQSVAGRTVYLWRGNGTFTNYVGEEAPRSTYPPGTPGLATWKPEEKGETSTNERYTESH